LRAPDNVLLVQFAPKGPKHESPGQDNASSASIVAALGKKNVGENSPERAIQGAFSPKHSVRHRQFGVGRAVREVRLERSLCGDVPLDSECTHELQMRSID